MSSKTIYIHIQIHIFIIVKLNIINNVSVNQDLEYESFLICPNQTHTCQVMV